MTLYHGTNRNFKKFDLSRNRTELVDSFYGGGIFLTPSKRVAWKYANANRNVGLDPEVIQDLKQKNPAAGAFLQTLCDHGVDGWEAYWKDHGFFRENPLPGEGQVDVESFERHLGVDSNTLGDIAGYILGSRTKPLGADDEGVINIFNQNTGMPDYIYDNLDEIGLDSSKYRPKVYTVSVTVSKPFVTANKSQARGARSKGYDSVVFYGSDLVDGVPEVAVFNPQNVQIKSVEVD